MKSYTVLILLVAMRNCFLGFGSNSVGVSFKCANMVDEHNNKTVDCSDANTKRNWGIGKVTHYLCKSQIKHYLYQVTMGNKPSIFCCCERGDIKVDE